MTTANKGLEWREGKPDAPGVFQTATDEEIRHGGYTSFFFQYWNGEFWMSSSLSPSNARKKSQSGCQDVKYRSFEEAIA